MTDTVKILKEAMGEKSLSRKDIIALGQKNGLTTESVDKVIYSNKHLHRTPKGSRGYTYSFNKPVAAAPAPKAEFALSTSVTSVKSEEVYVPSVVPEYVKWGQSRNIEMIIRSNEFFPVYISGPSGNGKTMMIEQVHAEIK